MNKLYIFLIIAIALLGAFFILIRDKAAVPDLTKSSDISNTNMVAVIKTNFGDIKLELFASDTPKTVENFINLAENGFYDGVKFHRVIKGFMIQGGDPLSKDDSQKDSWGMGGPGYTIQDEFVTGLSNIRGTISMANIGQPNSGGSQFFINLIDNINLDFDKEPPTSKHTVFGKVIAGMDVVAAIENSPTEGPDRPIDEVIIQSIEILRPQ